MNAEALIGMVLGTCTLQKLTGQGGMGAVFLAQQSRPRRQVAVKVLLPMTPLSPNQLAAFLERFRRETDAAASLEHPNIMPVHEYGERDGLAYLVMPYISGGTLRDELEQEGPLPLEKVVNYLDQIAAALDFAHEHGVIHRDVKPANILMTPERRLLLTDFGLVKIVAEGQEPQTRLTGAGAPVGTPDYMAPEQVIGEEVDHRADLYSLGIILYQMVTGTTPFQGETPMQIAAQHLQIPPPSPQMMRSDLPATTEQVMLRALAKRPSDRYAHAQELAAAFRVSLMGTGISLAASSGFSSAMSTITRSQTAMARGLLKPIQQTAALPPAGNDGTGLLSRTGMMPSLTRGSIPVASTETSRYGGGLLSRTGKFPMVGTGTLPIANPDSIVATPPAGGLSAFSAMQSATMPSEVRQLSSSMKKTTDSLTVAGQQGARNTVKLTGPVKVVKVPVAGQPGQFVTGLLPAAPPPSQTTTKVSRKASQPWMKIVAAIVAAVIILGVVGSFWLVRSRFNSTTSTSTTSPTMPKIASTPNVMATAMFQATAAAQANIIMSDPLDQNIHNWLTTPPNVYAFNNKAYHVTDRGDNGQATVLPANSFPNTLGYTLTMQEVGGNDASGNNSFGMIFRFNQQNKGGKTVTTFYSFEIVNTKGGEYQFWKYDDSQGGNTSPWMMIWHQNFGGELHQGQGNQARNTVKVFMDGKNFTLTVNGKKLDKTVQDGTLVSGTVGMIVNLKGTEVAFSNLLLTHN